MANKLYNLARMSTTTTGTGTITLGSAVSGFLSFSGAGVSDGDVVSYGIKDGTNSEVGTGTYTASGTTLTRTVTKSTNSNTAISLSGSAEVFITARAEDLTPQGLGGREVLTANRTYYVRTDGSDSNDGLSNTSGGAFATAQGVWDHICNNLDLNGSDVDIQFGAGTYTAGLLTFVPPVGKGIITFIGDTTTPANVVIAGTSGWSFNYAGLIFIRGFKFNVNGLIQLSAAYGTHIILDEAFELGGQATNTRQFSATHGGVIEVTHDFDVTGGSVGVFGYIDHGGAIYCVSRTITFLASTAYATAFIYARAGSWCPINGCTFTGTVTGKRYDVSYNASIYVGGAGETYLPGDTAGVRSSGGIYDAGGREVLTADRTYYVRTDGSDSNNGLANTSGGAFLTIQKAINVVAALDISIYNVTIQVAAGTYTGTVTVNGPWVGKGTVTLSGDTTTPSNVLISTSGSCITVQSGATLSIKGFKFTSSAGLALIYAKQYGVATLSGKNEFGASTHDLVADTGTIIAGAPEIVSGTTAGGHYYAQTGGIINCANATWTASGTATFNVAFVFAQATGVVFAFNNTSSGTFSGARYSAQLNAVVTTNGGGASYFPGSSAGSTATGGQYS